jgi:hypothetical protein
MDAFHGTGVCAARCYHHPGENIVDKFTPEAKRFWQGLPDGHKELIIANVWCGSCRNAMTIVNFSGKVEGGDLILEGECQKCGDPIARLIDGG